ncbi:hypothetical protein BO71DRAFT_450625 [Aspergillus ellipticus CBS 707.79]|uniref:Uncharacterized protein n=1 Tax=Aspergillus ellipticus CBS 707.79 TaxID=1448320 RepID=A0A319D829_9EURO|nr:hypothetical protein BO71DRAFT_450625 [Aspergillus ellipticus CBS 707.79]
MQGLYKASKLFREQSRLFIDSRRDLQPLKQNCSANLKFNISVLQQIAGCIASSRYVEIMKIPEGLYNKIFSLKMENGREILARIPNPNTGYPQRVVASEVATLDFYIFIERGAMSEAQHFGLVKSLVEIEQKLVNVKFPLHGSLYYKSTYYYSGNTVDPIEPVKKVMSDFVIEGTAQEYLLSVVNREIAVIQNLGPSISSNMSMLLEKTKQSCNNIINWQGVYTAPLFLQARFPSIFNYNNPYPWGAVQPKLPKDFDTLSQSEKELAKDTLVRLRLKKFYELALRKFNQSLVMAIDIIRNNNNPTTFIFYIVEQSSQDERRGLVNKWADIFSEFNSLRTDIVGKDGWNNNRAILELL